MSQPPTSAIAKPFVWQSTGPDFSITYGGVTTPFALPYGTYTMFMGEEFGGGAIYYRNAMAVIVATLNLFYGGTPTFSYSMDAATGRWSLSATNAFTYAVVSTQFDDLFGNMVTSGAAKVTSAHSPYGLLLFSSTVGNDWQQLTPLAGATDESGRVYAIPSGVTRYTDEIEFSFIPVNPTERTAAGTVCAPWFPSNPNLTGTVVFDSTHPWTVSAHLQASLGTYQAFARGNWADVCSDPNAYFDIITIPPEEVAAPRVSMQFAAWKRWRKWVTKLTRRGTSPVCTRNST